MSLLVLAFSGSHSGTHLLDKGLPIRAVTRSERDRFEASMTAAFTTDALARWIWPDALQYLNAFPPFVTLFGGVSFEHGSAHVVGDFFGTAQWIPPGIHSDEGPVVELLEKTVSGPRLGELLSLFERMADFHPDAPHWYLPLIGVDPIHRGRGYGAQLMRHALDACDRDGHPAYLEATSQSSRALYERHGFRAIGEISSTDAPLVFPMVRSPGALPETASSESRR